MTDDDFREMRERWGEREWARRFPGAADPTLRHPTQPPPCIRTGQHTWIDSADAAAALAESMAAYGFVASGLAASGGIECAHCGLRPMAAT